jgi:hypothetical protein
LTHEEIGQMIGTSREKVSRLFAGFKKQRVIQQNGATLVIQNRVTRISFLTLGENSSWLADPPPGRRPDLLCRSSLEMVASNGSY